MEGVEERNGGSKRKKWRAWKNEMEGVKEWKRKEEKEEFEKTKVEDEEEMEKKKENEK